jgi:uncharacterized protein (TIRG00374 family)
MLLIWFLCNGRVRFPDASILQRASRWKGKKGDRELMRGRFFKIILQWGLGLLLLLLLFVFGDVRQITRLPEIHWGYVFVVFLCDLGFSFSHNFRWKEIVENLSARKGGDFFFLYRSLIDSYAVGRLIPMDVSLIGVRSYYLNRYRNMPMSMAVFSVLLDKFMDVVIFLLMAVPSFLLITRTVSVGGSFLILGLLLVGQVLVLFWKKGETFRLLFSFYRTFVVRWCSKIPFLGIRMKEDAEGIGENVHFPLSSVFRTMGWNYVKYISFCLRFYFTGQALGVPFSMLETFFFIPVVQASGFVSITPGGLGVIELSTYGALFLMRVPPSQILIFVFGQRILLTLIFLCLFVLIRLFYLVQCRWKRIEGLG